MKLASGLIGIALVALPLAAGCSSTSYVAKPVVDTPATGTSDGNAASFSGAEQGSHDIYRNADSPDFPDHSLTMSPGHGETEGDHGTRTSTARDHPDTTIPVHDH